jgi:hypothetical protein
MTIRGSAAEVSTQCELTATIECDDEWTDAVMVGW